MNKTSRVEFTVELVRILTAIAIAYAVALVTLFAVSDDPIYIIQQFVLGPFSSVRRVGSIINLAIPFTFTGLCFCFMYAVNKFNLAGEGIFMFAGCVISWVAIKLGESVPAPVMIGLLLVIGALTGVVVSALPAWLDSKFNANIVVSSLMLNSILMFLSIYIMMYTMRDTTIGSLGSLPIPDNAKLPQILGKFRIQAGLVIALIAVILVAVLFYKMVFGYKMRVVGSNPWFAKACGICEILGNYDRYNWVATTQHGFDGLMVAVLARKNPLLVPVAACLLAYIRIGADVVNSKGDIPIEFITVIQGIVILMVAAEEFMGRYKKKLIYKAAEEELAAKEKAEKESAASKGKEE